MLRRPVVLTVFGILNLCLAGLGLLMAVQALITIAWPPQLPIANPVLDVVQHDPQYKKWVVATWLITVLMSCLLALAGLGLLKSKPWGRSLSIVWALAALGIFVVTLVVNCAYLGPAVATMLTQHPPGRPLTPEEIAGFGIAFGVLAAGIPRLIYLIVLLVFMLHPSTTVALRTVGEP